jgi:prepilin-type N-terminal cleavage/methylation domain-containing protein
MSRGGKADLCLPPDRRLGERSSANHPPEGSAAVTRRFNDDESGLTLIELMVSMFLLSIILAAAAGSLITFSKASVDNEGASRRRAS